MKRSILFLLIIGRLALALDVAENTYTVPVKRELKSFATFEIHDAELRLRKDGRAKIEYTFPAYLIGQEDFFIEAKGTWTDLNKPIFLSGEFGKFECRVKEAGTTCRATYLRETLPVLKPAGFQVAEAYLKAEINNPQELDARRLVLAAFSHEAAGNFEKLRVRFK